MRSNIEEIKATIVTMHLYAPFDGTVVEKQGEVGEIISPSAMSSSLGRTAVVTIADLQHMDVETNISEARLADRDRTAREVSVTRHSLQALPGPAPADLADERSDSHATVKVKVEILDPDDKLFPELAATVHFLASESANSPDAGRSFLFVPKSAVFHEDGHDLRLARPQRQYPAQEPGRGRHDHRRPGAG